MVRFRKKILENRIYIPKVIREGIGKNKELILQPNTNCFLVYPSDIPLDRIKRSMNLIQAELDELQENEELELKK